MAVAAGTVACGTVRIISVDLVGGKLVEFIWTTQSAADGHLPFLARAMVEAGGEVVGDGLMAAAALISIVE
jgi:hypothetical protein